ncbi:hypothetical protein JAAARDRAFT_200785 [Jaapia argillacea MUCL 33604]|uniref:Uncharacterized protein n=1 Tax=Jaapia argillacea MUCL 33604 TaxID=933084 RepID=A0A067P437_9AGAM|nr:hypothetical protein JAAARDRAFT_200785 [Jaapia argillacea MUCL 33604]
MTIFLQGEISLGTALTRFLWFKGASRPAMLVPTSTPHISDHLPNEPLIVHGRSLGLFTEFDMLKKPSETFEIEAKHLLDHTKVALTILLGFFAVEMTISNNSFATAFAGTLIIFTYNLFTKYQLHGSANLKSHIDVLGHRTLAILNAIPNFEIFVLTIIKLYQLVGNPFGVLGVMVMGATPTILVWVMRLWGWIVGGEGWEDGDSA